MLRQSFLIQKNKFIASLAFYSSEDDISQVGTSMRSIAGPRVVLSIASWAVTAKSIGAPKAT